MKFVWLDWLGDWNPQLLREVKGRLKPLNVTIAIAISLLGQFLLFQYFQTQLPVVPRPGEYTYPTYHRFCTGIADSPKSKVYLCLRDNLGNFVINWQNWWLDVFVWLSFIAISALLVVGSYMLIADLVQEERRGNLNFIRLSPEPTQRFLIGKQLGVPILLYLVAALALPLHLWAGLSAQIPLGQILGFDGVVVASCIFFYSAALLYGLVSNWLGGFQAWLGSGIVLGFLFLTVRMIDDLPMNTPLAWIRLFTPFDLIPNLAMSNLYAQQALERLQWFYLPLGGSAVILFSFAILNYSLWTYWSWQGMQRCFRNPNATIFSKRQSYLLTACFAVSTLGFAVPGAIDHFGSFSRDWLFSHLLVLCLFDLVLFLCLIAALSPHRQPLQDWARYRREKFPIHNSFWKSSLVQDLIWAEKSPALMAVGINIIIAIIPLGLFVLTSPVASSYKMSVFVCLGLAASLVMLYAAIAQRILFMKTQNRIYWAIGTVGAVILLPPTILGLLSIQAGTTVGFFWLFTVFAPVFVLSPLENSLSTMTVLLGLLGQWSIWGLIGWQLTRQLQQAGESTTKTLLAGR